MYIYTCMATSCRSVRSRREAPACAWVRSPCTRSSGDINGWSRVPSTLGPSLVETLDRLGSPGVCSLQPVVSWRIEAPAAPPNKSPLYIWVHARPSTSGIPSKLNSSRDKEDRRPAALCIARVGRQDTALCPLHPLTCGQSGG